MPAWRPGQSPGLSHHAPSPRRSRRSARIWSPGLEVSPYGEISSPQDGVGFRKCRVSALEGVRRLQTGKPCPLHPQGGAQQVISRWLPLGLGEPRSQPVARKAWGGRQPSALSTTAERRGEVWAIGPRFQPLPSGYQIPMRREREMEPERDELDSLAAEAGNSAGLIGMTVLILVMALVLGFVV